MPSLKSPLSYPCILPSPVYLPFQEECYICVHHHHHLTFPLFTTILNRDSLPKDPTVNIQSTFCPYVFAKISSVTHAHPLDLCPCAEVLSRSLLPFPLISSSVSPRSALSNLSSSQSKSILLPCASQGRHLLKTTLLRVFVSVCHSFT